MSIKVNNLNVKNDNSVGYDLARNSKSIILSVSKPPGYKNNDGQAIVNDSHYYFAILNNFNSNTSFYFENSLYRLYNLDKKTKKPGDYYKVASSKNKNFDSFVYDAVKKINSLAFNKIVNGSHYIIMYNGKTSKTWSKLRETGESGAPGSTLMSFSELKIESGATANEGNGFFYQAGIYENGKRDLNSRRYALIAWSRSSSEPGRIDVIGSGGDVRKKIEEMLKVNNGPSNNTLQYVLIQVDNNKYGYNEICGTFESPSSLSIIFTFMGDSKNNIDLSTTSSSGGSWGDSLNFSSAEVNPYTNLTSTSVNPVEYIKDFINYKLVFKSGKDERTTITDLFEKPEDKVISDDINSENLIIRAKVSNEQLNQASSNMTLSDKYYLYVETENDDMISESNFFEKIDNILKINTSETAEIWNTDDKEPPVVFSDKWKRLPQTACAIDKEKYKELIKNEETITLQLIKNKGYKITNLKDFITNKERSKLKLLIFDILEDKTTQLSDDPSLTNFLSKISEITKYTNKTAYKATFNFVQERKSINLYSLQLMKAYTRGHDFIQENYTTVRAKELQDNKRVMNFDDNYFVYKYSGRDFDIMRKRDGKDIFTFSNGVSAALAHECDILLETDITLGESYGQKKYFIEYLKYKDKKGENLYKDTFKVKDYLEAIDATKYTEEDIEVVTSHIDLTQCQYYDPTQAKYENKWCDCSYGTNGEYKKECVYQKLGYCPYRFSTEKHPRRIRTLSQSKSNRFNLIQELSKVFKIYPQFYIEFDRNGRIKLDENGRMKKHVFFMTEKGNKNQLGFRYEKNLADISRTVDSASLTTKLFVENVDSELSKTGLCSIQTAEDNISKTSYILDFSYYTKMNILDPVQVTKDLYGLNKGDFAFLPTIGYYNTQYDKLTNLIVNLTGETMVKLQAENDTYIQGVTTALEEKQKICQHMYQFKVKSYKDEKYDYTISDSYKNYLIKMKEQSTILWGLIETLFFTNSYCNLITKNDDNTYSLKSIDINNYAENDLINKYKKTYCLGELFWRLHIEGFDEEEDYKPIFSNWNGFKEEIIDKNLYTINGCLGQYNDMLNQVKKWKKERAKWLNKINDISERFYKKYEPFLKEGTWTDSNYLTDNEYYWAAVNVLNDSSQPKITYILKVVDLSPLDSDYKFELADTSFVEDIDFFGINQKTGLPNQQKVLISALDFDLDLPVNDSIDVKSYTSSFDELFQSISASVQSLTFNENTYKRAANFTATKYIEKDALQGTLFDGDLTLVQDYSENVIIDDKGVSGKNIGNNALGYKLDGEGLAFTRDNGQTYDIGVGPNGINADYIKFGQLDASKIQIVDGNYIYFLWDKDGINAYRNPATGTNGLVDFTRFNRYGLSLIENSNVRLRAGYEFKNDPYRNTSGNYNTELELENQNIGFYLYNDSGQAIFKTETASDYSGVEGDYSARLSLTGEMFITNKVLEGENDGSIISKTEEISLQGSWFIARKHILALYPQNIWKGLFEQLSNVWNDELGFTNDEPNNICIENAKIENGKVIYTINSKIEDNSIVTLYSWVFRNIQTHDDILEYSCDSAGKIITKENPKLFKKLNCNYIRYILDFSSGEYTIIEQDDSNTKVEVSLETIKNKMKNSVNSNMSLLTVWNKYTDETNTVLEASYTNEVKTLFVSTENHPTETTLIVDNITAEIVTFFELSKLEIGQSTEAMTQTLYPYSYGTSGGTVNYWTSKRNTGNYVTQATSTIKTEEVGIFINNKLGLDEGGSNSIQSSDTIADEESNEETNEEEITSMSNRASNVDITSSSFLIIGDSITEGLSTTELDSNAFGVESSNFDNSSKFDGLKDISGKTDVAYFMGMNEGFNDVETYKQRYKTFIDETLKKFPDSDKAKNVYLISIIALDESKGGSNQTTEVIEKANKAIEELANENSYGFIDIYSASKNFDHSDKVHLTADGYKQLFEQLKNVFGGTINIGGSSSGDSASGDPGAEAAANTAVGGAERIFTIALKGQTDDNTVEYKNILTVLKNGYLYMGGTISDFYGSKLELSSFNLLPDKIRISNPQFVLSNNGYMWFDFYKTFPIADGQLTYGMSLMDMLNAGGGLGGSSSGTNTGLPSGYYLIDPLSD